MHVQGLHYTDARIDYCTHSLTGYLRITLCLDLLKLHSRTHFSANQRYDMFCNVPLLSIRSSLHTPRHHRLGEFAEVYSPLKGPGCQRYHFALGNIRYAGSLQSFQMENLNRRNPNCAENAQKKKESAVETSWLAQFERLPLSGLKRCGALGWVWRARTRFHSI